MELGEFGVWQMVSRSTPELADMVEKIGYGAIWVGGSPSGDLLEVERLCAATARLPVATGIINIWRDKADKVAESFHRVEARHPGRLLLGIGVGHPESVDEYRKPYDAIVEYIDHLAGAGIPKDRLMLAALGPKVTALAGSRTAGVHPYLTTADHTRWARGILGAGPLLAPEIKVILDPDPEQARVRGRAAVSPYLTRVNYRNSLLRQGWSAEDLAGGGSDRLIDTLVTHGTPQDVTADIRSHLEAGADHVAIQVIGSDLESSYSQLLTALSS